MGGFQPSRASKSFVKRCSSGAGGGGILDADYERVSLAVEDDADIDSNDSNTLERNNIDDDDDSKDDGSSEIPVFRTNSLLDLTLLDNNVTFPFVESRTQQSLSCRLAVTAELEDEQMYAIGIPAQHGVLMVIERGRGVGSSGAYTPVNTNKKYQEADDDDDHPIVEYIDPDLDDNVEVLELMAGALQKYIGPDLVLQRTPRILTIAGDLDQYVNALPGNLVPTDITMDKLMEEPDGDLDKLFDFFKEQMGKDVFDQTMAEATELDPNLASLFEMSEEEADSDDDAPFNLDDFEEAFRNLSSDIQHQGVGIKLVGFQVNNNDEKGKDKNNAPPAFYSLVKPIQPLTVVGRLKRDQKETVFELLTPEEEALIVPRLEQVCKKDMEAQGLL